MKSIELYTEEIDDMEEVAEELFSQMGRVEIQKNSLIIVFV